MIHAQTRMQDIGHHLERVHTCMREWNGRPLAMSTPAGERYPFVYPRDTAVILRAYEGLHAMGHVGRADADAALRGGAEFLLDAQGPGGAWGQRYDLDARDESIYPQEDNVAHALTVIARHVLHHRARNEVSPIEPACVDALVRGMRAADALRDPGLGLYRSTTSVHESRIERGFTLWVNGAFALALERSAAAARAAGRVDLADAWVDAREALVAAIDRHLVRDGRFVRRLTSDREVDARPDVTLLSPWFFGFRDVDAAAEDAGVAFMEDHLVDPDLLLLARYPATPGDPGAHMHGGHGPYLSFSSWWTQREAQVGNPARARERVARIAALATRDGDLPEHVATTRAFGLFMRDEFLTGLDFRKEFDEAVLLDHVDWNVMLREADRMTGAYAKADASASDNGDGVIRLAAPHAWTHADYAYALALVHAPR